MVHASFVQLDKLTCLVVRYNHKTTRDRFSAHGVFFAIISLWFFQKLRKIEFGFCLTEATFIII